MTTTPFVGELAGLGTALAWSLSAIAWTSAGRRVGAVPVAAVRLLLATAALAAFHALQCGTPWPTGYRADAQGLLMASGAIGAGLGDMCFFFALKLIGARLGMLVATISPGFAALFALVTPLGDRVNAAGAAGMALTMIGVAWAVLAEQGPHAAELERRTLWRGVGYAAAASVFFAIGFTLSRLGMHVDPAHPVPPLAASLFRVAAGAVFIWACLPFLGGWGGALRTMRNGRVMRTILWGTAVGPILGIWLSMVSLDGVETGVATALISAGPALFMLPLAYLAHRERPSRHGLFGTLIACAGVAVLLLRNRF